MLLLDNVSKAYTLKYQTVNAVEGVSLSVSRGEYLVITGRSGSGKTTLLNLAAGLARPTGGRVLLDGSEIWKMPDRQQAWFRSRNIGFVFQFPSLIPTLTVLENVLLPTTFGSEQEKAEAVRHGEALLDEVGLSDKLNVYPRQLSAGQQQRVVLARALINHPKLLLADEPTSNLDEETEGEIMGLIKSFHEKGGITVVMVTHAAELVRYGTHSAMMAGGRLLN